MLRTNNKRLHSNLWTLAHFVGSAFIFVALFMCIYYFNIYPHGAYTTPTSWQTVPQARIDWLNNFITNTNFAVFLPISQLMRYIFTYTASTSLNALPFVMGLALDFVLWFNVALWTLQLLVFIPDACFHWLEKKKED